MLCVSLGLQPNKALRLTTIAPWLQYAAASHVCRNCGAEKIEHRRCKIDERHSLPIQFDPVISHHQKSLLGRTVRQVTVIAPVNRVEDPAPLGMPEQAKVKIRKLLIN